MIRSKRRLQLIGLSSVVMVTILGLFLIVDRYRKAPSEHRLVTQYTIGALAWGQIEVLGASIVEPLAGQLVVFPSAGSQTYRTIWPYLPTQIVERLEPPIKHEMVRLRAIEGLRSLGEISLPAIPSLLTCLNDPVQRIRIAALRAVESLGGDREALLSSVRASIENPFPAHDLVWKTTTRNGKMIGSKGVVMSARPYRYRNEVARWLGRLGADHVPYAVGICLEHLGDETITASQRVETLVVLAEIAPERLAERFDLVVDEFSEAVVRGDYSTLQQLLRCFRVVGEEGKKAVLEILNLIELLQDVPNQDGLLMNAVGMVGNLDPSSTRTLSVLSKLSKHPNKDVRYNAVYSTGQLTLARDAMMEALALFREDDSLRVQVSALAKLANLDASEVVECLRVCLEILESADSLAKKEALSIIEETGRKMEGIYSILVKRRDIEEDPAVVADFDRIISSLSEIE